MKKYTLSSQQLLYIELELNKIKFRDVEIGGILIDFFYSNCFFSSFEINLTSTLLSFGSLIKEEFSIYPLNGNQNWQTISNKVILAPSANLSKNLEFFYPLINNNNENDFCFIGRKNFPINYRKIPFLGFDNINYPDYKVWKSYFFEVKDNLFNLIKKLSLEFGFPLSFYIQLKRYIILQTKILSYFIDLFNKYKPKLILTDHDRMKFNSCLIIAANVNEIPTYSFIHGSTIPPDHYYPVLANKLFCWGEFHKNQFKNLGTPIDKLIVAGNQKINLDISIDIDKVLNRLNLNTKPVVLLATNNIKIKEKLLFAEEFCKVCKQIEIQMQAVIRLHPSETKGEYKEIIKEYPFIKLLENSDLNAEESFAISSIIVSHNSQYGFDAFVHKKKIVIFDSMSVSFPIGIGGLLAKMGCMLAHNESELKAALIDLLNCSDQKLNVVTEGSIDFCFTYGQDSVNIILNEIKPQLIR
jgi:hypothetical protein